MDITLPSNPGNVVKIGGECYEFSGTNRGTPTNTLEDVQGVFDTCEDCQSLSSSSSSMSNSMSMSSSSNSNSSSSSSSSLTAVALAECQCATNSDKPRLKVTVCWTDLDTTKSWAGCNWTNGESKEMCPNVRYDEQVSIVTLESWVGGAEFGEGIKLIAWQYAYAPSIAQFETRFQNQAVYADIFYRHANAFTNVTNFAPVPNPTLFPTYAPLQSTIYFERNAVVGKLLNEQLTQSITDTSGFTVTWAPLQGVGAAAWRATTLNYAPASGNDACP